MIYTVSKCVECPMQFAGETPVCQADVQAKREIPADVENRPEWCPLNQSSFAVDDRECAVCPFHHRQEMRRCSVATPRFRPMAEEEVRPSWCVLRRERFIIKLPR
ncbi:hypothetical protein [Oleidesulfovibrio sp.]|uniref:hypothetical protein n=1 Tax=Oleidesulfovibrio sp. TaxID=2909707 RepID=UPI003A8BE7B4